MADSGSAPSPLSAVLRDLLDRNGVRMEALHDVKAATLARDLRISQEQAVVFKREIDIALGRVATCGRGVNACTGQTALELIQQRQGVSHVVTFCRELDELMGGGGVPGAGKTQLCMQLALDVQIPVELGGVEGAAVYIDTEGSLVPARLEQMARAVHRHLSAIIKKKLSPESEAVAKCLARLQPQRLLESIHVFRCTHLAEQTAVVHGLISFLEANSDVRLVILDSVTFHYRYATDGDLAARARQLQAVSQALHRVAASYDCAVVVINHMTTRGGDGPAAPGSAAASTDTVPMEGAGRLVPALGETWAHACTNRLLLGWAGTQRVAELVKSPTRRPGRVAFTVSAEGFRGFKRGVPAPAVADPGAPGIDTSAIAAARAGFKRRAEGDAEGAACPEAPADGDRA